MPKNHPVLQEALNTYRRVFADDPEIQVFAPGRVNLIGEHTDYNDGFVLPFALPFKCVIVGSISTSRDSKIISTTMNNDKEEPISFKINHQLKKGEPSWANYVKGVVSQYLDDLPENFAFNAVIASNVPLGSGLSSSAALEVATATFLEKICRISHVSGVSKALRCQQAEHTFCNTPCGIMDQYISAMGKRGNLLLIDCREKDYKLVPFGRDTMGPVLLVTNSNVTHALADGAYAVRVRQCQEAVQVLAQSFSHVTALRDASMDNLEAVREQMDELVFARALHVISENARTLATVEALERGDFHSVGEKMTSSHESLRDCYEVSCKELDFLVEQALEVPGVLGSRMTGGGFGGCTVTLVERNAVRILEMHLKKKYREEFNMECECYECLPSPGAGDFGSLLPSDSTHDPEDDNRRLRESGTSQGWLWSACAVGVILGTVFFWYGSSQNKKI